MLKKIVIVFLMIFLILSSLLSTFTVFAEESSDSKDADSLVDSGTVDYKETTQNVLKIAKSNLELKGRITQSLKYNEQVQYLMTYAILKGGYMDTENYKNLYVGSVSEGSTDGISGLDVKMGYNAILQSSEDASNSHQEADNKDKKDTSDKEQKEYEQATKTLSEKIADELFKLYIQKYLVNNVDKYEYDSKKGLLKIKYKLSGYKNNATTLTFANKKFANVSSSTVNNVFKEAKSDSQQKLIYNSIQSSVYQKLSSGVLQDALLVNLSGDIVAEKYMKETKLNVKYPYVEKNVLSFDTNYFVVEITQPSTTKYSESKMKKLSKLYPIFDRDSRTRNANNDAFNSLYIKKIESLKKSLPNTTEYKTWKTTYDKVKGKNERGKTDALKDNVSGIGWVPLDYFVTNKINNDTFKTLIHQFDKGIISGDGRVLVENANGHQGRRSVQVNDFVAIKQNVGGSRKPSASPYLTYDYKKNKNSGVGTARAGSIQLGSNLGLYAGMKTIELSNWDHIKNKVKSLIGDSEYGIAVPLTKTEIMVNANQLYPHKYISYMNSKGDKVEGITKGADYTVGIDNYGNIISGSTLQVIVPYWHNTEVSEFKDFNTSKSFFVSSPVFQEEISGELASILKQSTEGGKPKENENIEIDSFSVNVGNYSTFLKSLSNRVGDNITAFDDLKDKTANTKIQALALSIVSQTKKDVEKYNQKFISSIDRNGEVYLTASGAGRASESAAGEDVLEKFNAADFLEKISLIFDVGVYEILRLTIVSWVVSFYTSSISNYSLSSIFHTSVISDSSIWKDLIVSFAKLLGGFVGIYMVYLTYRVMRNTLPFKKMVSQVLTLASVLVLPIVVYGPMVHLFLNKPAQFVVGTQMEQMSILDNYLFRYENKLQEQDEIYSMLFGSVADIRDRSQDYLVTFYTTQHVDGFDITDVKQTDLTNKNRLRSLEAIEDGKWRPQDLIKVKISIFDLFTWVQDLETTDTLFNYLANTKPDRYGDLSQYKEYSSTAEANIKVSNVKYTASEVYKMIYKGTYETQDYIEGLYHISKAFRNTSLDQEASKITDSDREALIRDLSLTSTIRKQLYGGNGQSMSPAATELWSKYGRGVEIPKSDMFNLSGTVNRLVPKRDFFAKKLESDVYNINREVIDNYITNYSIVRDSVNLTDNDFKYAEFQIIVLDMWFKVNETLKIHNFPTYYEVSTISMDNYMRLAFVPLEAYHNIQEKGLENVAQYISLRSHPMTLLFIFIPMLILLLIFGMLYLAMFYVLMMLISTASFTWHYIIKNNYQNKSWLGTLVIFTTFAVAKLGLVILWKVMSFAMNYFSVLFEGVHYPYVLFHSIITVVYLSLVLYFLFTKVLKSVWQDKANLGGEIFQDKMKGMVEKVSSFFKDNKGNWGNYIKSKFGGNNGDSKSSVDDILQSEGAEGTVDTSNNGFLKGRIAKLLGRGNKDEVQSDIEDLSHAIHDDGSLGEGHEFAIRFAGTSEGIDRDGMYEMGLDYDKIKESKAGLSDDQINAYNESDTGIGTIIHDGANGDQLVKFNAGSSENANILVSELQKQGIKAVVGENGQSVVLNASGVNMKDAGVRKKLFGGVIDKLLNDTHKFSKVIEKEETVSNYSNNKDGSYTIRVGEDGLSTETLDMLLNSVAFKENFIVEETPIKKDGKYIQGGLKVFARNNNVAENIQDVINTVFQTDDYLRNVNGISSRQEYKRNTIEFNNDDETESRIIQSNLADGMQIQNGKLIYDKQDENQVKAVNEIKSMLYRHRDGKQQASVDLMKRVMSQVNYGGNNGFFMERTDTKEDKDMAAFAQAYGIDTQDEVKVFGGKHSNGIVKMANQIKKINETSPEMLENYLMKRDKFYSHGEHLLLQKEGNDYGAVMDSLLKYAGDNGLNREVGKISSEIENLKRLRDRAEVSEEEFVRMSESLIADLQIRLQDKGLYDQFIAMSLRESIKKEKDDESKATYQKILDDFIHSKVALKDNGIDTSTLERYSEEDFSRFYGYLQNIDSLTSNSDNTITIKKNKGAKDVDVSEFVKQLAEQESTHRRATRKGFGVIFTSIEDKLREERERRTIKEKREQERNLQSNKSTDFSIFDEGLK